MLLLVTKRVAIILLPVQELFVAVSSRQTVKPQVNKGHVLHKQLLHYTLPLIFLVIIIVFSMTHFIGFVLHYCLLQYTVWSVMHLIFMFWSIEFPFSYRQLKISGRIRYAHVGSVVLAILIPLPAGLIHLKDGYVDSLIPSLSIGCVGLRFDYNYYTLILPLSVLVAIATCLLVLIIWTLFKVRKQQPACLPA